MTVSVTRAPVASVAAEVPAVAGGQDRLRAGALTPP